MTDRRPLSERITEWLSKSMAIRDRMDHRCAHRIAPRRHHPCRDGCLRCPEYRWRSPQVKSRLVRRRAALMGYSKAPRIVAGRWVNATPQHVWGGEECMAGCDWVIE